MPGIVKSVLFGFCFYIAVAGGTAAAIDAEEVFKQDSPSIVLIRDWEGHGSGVVINEKGYVVTNYHVVNSPLPLEVVAMARKGGKIEETVFTDVKLDKVHPKYDAAVLKIALPIGVSLIPAQYKGAAAPSPGAACYVIGNPGGAGGEALCNTITTGIISADEREFEGLKYIQTNAAINHGNSGGALLDKNGKLLGIVTFKITNTEGIGFAIPFSQLQYPSFVAVKERKGDVAECIRWEDAGSKYFDAAMKLPEGDKRDLLFGLALFCFRKRSAD